VTGSTRVTLRASKSDADGDSVRSAWRQLTGPAVSVCLRAPNSDVIEFVAPELDGELRFAVTVTDSLGLVHTDEVAIHVVRSRPPTLTPTPEATGSWWPVETPTATPPPACSVVDQLPAPTPAAPPTLVAPGTVAPPLTPAPGTPPAPSTTPLPTLTLNPTAALIGTAVASGSKPAWLRQSFLPVARR
jgi:hypothetical protein